MLLDSTTSLISNAADLINLKDFPSWFREAISRESKLTETSKFKIDKFNINAHVMVKLNLLEDSKGTLYRMIDIGSASLFEYYVFSEFDGQANSGDIIFIQQEHTIGLIMARTICSSCKTVTLNTTSKQPLKVLLQKLKIIPIV